MYIQTALDQPSPFLTFLSLSVVTFHFSSGKLNVPLELMFWLAGLVTLGLIDPLATALPDLCLYKLAGFESCPGCGLGRSVSFLLHGEAVKSLDAHLLGPFALCVILYRIFDLTKSTFTIQRKEHSHA